MVKKGMKTIGIIRNATKVDQNFREIKFRFSFILIVIALFVNCSLIFTDDDYIRVKYECGGLAWIGLDSLIYLNQEYADSINDNILFPRYSVVGTKLVLLKINSPLKAVKTIELEPKGKIIDDIRLSHHNGLISYDYRSSEHMYDVPYSYFYSFYENNFRSIKFEQYRLLNFTANGNLLAEKGNWGYIMGGPCGSSDCMNGYYWFFKKYVVIDIEGNEIYESIVKPGIPNPKEDVLLTTESPISIESFPKGSILYVTQDSLFDILISWSADGTKFMYVNSKKVVTIYSYKPDIAILNTIQLDYTPLHVCISPDGKYFATSTKECIKIYNQNGKHLGTHTP